MRGCSVFRGGVFPPRPASGFCRRRGEDSVQPLKLQHPRNPAIPAKGGTGKHRRPIGRRSERNPANQGDEPAKTNLYTKFCVQKSPRFDQKRGFLRGFPPKGDLQAPEMGFDSPCGHSRPAGGRITTPVPGLYGATIVRDRCDRGLPCRRWRHDRDIAASNPRRRRQALPDSPSGRGKKPRPAGTRPLRSSAQGGTYSEWAQFCAADLRPCPSLPPVD